MTPIESWLSSYATLTQANYARVLARFVATTGKAVTDANQDDVVAYHAAISNSLSPATVALHLAALSSFFTYLTKTGKRSDNPMVAIAHFPKVDKLRSVRWLTQDQQRALLQSIGESGDHAVDARNRALVWVFLHGLRLAEVVSLNVEDYRDGELRFSGKGGKSRIVPMLVPAQAALNHYLDGRRTGPLFRSESTGAARRKLPRRQRLSRRHVQTIVADLTEKAGARIHPHGLRHSFASRLVKSGVGMPQLQRLLGHSDLKSTSIYIHLDTDDLHQAMSNDPLGEPAGLQVIEGGKEATG